MTEFDYERHLVKGDADTAHSWIESSTLSEEQKADLRRFVTNFPTLTFAKEDDAVLDHYEEIDRVVLPPWLRQIRATLAFVDPPMLLRVDDFQSYESPRSDDVEDIWYNLRFGYQGDEQRTLFLDDAGVYRIGVWWEDAESYLGVKLDDPEDRRIFDFSGADLRDNKLAGRPVRGSLYPVFGSYTELLAHITDIRPFDVA